MNNRTEGVFEKKYNGEEGCTWHSALVEVGMDYEEVGLYEDPKRASNYCQVCRCGVDEVGNIGGYQVCPECAFKAARVRRRQLGAGRGTP